MVTENSIFIHTVIDLKWHMNTYTPHCIRLGITCVVHNRSGVKHILGQHILASVAK